MPIGHPLIFPIIIYYIFNDIESHLTIKEKKITILFIFSLYSPKKKKKKPLLYSFSFANVVFKAKLKGPILLPLKEPYVIFINFKR